MIDIKDEVLSANRWIVDKKLVELTWGNVSAIDKESQNIYIKPSGVRLQDTTPQDIAVVDQAGLHIEGLKPSVDTPTHVALYKEFADIGCVIHTHSKYSTIFAQAGKDIPCLGTTHADYYYGSIPCVPHPKEEEAAQEYELNTGKIICAHYSNNNIDYRQIPACTVQGHGVFVWGKDIQDALQNAYVLEVVAEMAYKTLLINPASSLADYILDKHFLRKHGDNKYYGQ